MKLHLLLLSAALSLPLAACGDRSAGNDPDVSGVARTVRNATDKAGEKMAENNIKISSGKAAHAEITPAGDLVIEGRTVDVDQAQRELLLAYRGQVIEMAQTGIDIGVQGADLGVKAAGEALKGVFSGNTDQIEQNIKAEAKKIEQQAQRLCDQLPAMRQTQQQLAASLPAFAPYAKMDEDDVEECRANARADHDDAATEAGAQ